MYYFEVTHLIEKDFKELKATKQLIGTDASLDVCRFEGYVMMITEGHKTFNPDHSYTVYQFSNNGSNLTKIEYSWNELKERYSRYQQGIDRFSDDMPERMKQVEPSFYDFMHAFETINQYCGI